MSSAAQSSYHDWKSSTGVSRQQFQKLTFVWIIENFKHVMLDQIGDEIESPVFEDVDVHESKWRLELSRYNSQQLPVLSLYARLLDCKEETLTAKCRFSIIDSDGVEVFTQSHLEAVRGVLVNSPLGWWNFISFDELSLNYQKYLNRKSLKIVCNICIIGDVTVSPMDVNYSGMKIPRSRFAEDMESLLSMPSTSDVVLCSSGKEFNCHKAILVARSPVFAAMLGHEMEEKLQNKVKIEGIEKEVLQEMLRFIYTDNVKDIKEIALSLYYAADRYCLERLKVICERQLAKDLTVDNAVDVLVCADRLSSERLKTHVKRFICYKMKQVVKTDSWMLLMQRDINLLNELIQYCVDIAPSI